MKSFKFEQHYVPVVEYSLFLCHQLRRSCPDILVSGCTSVCRLSVKNCARQAFCIIPVFKWCCFDMDLQMSQQVLYVESSSLLHYRLYL